MKFIAFFILTSLTQTLVAGQTQGLHPFTLKGIIKGMDSGYVYLNYIPNGEMGIFDSCKLENGRFVYRGWVTEPTKAWFSTFGRRTMPDEKNLTQFYIEPGELKLLANYNQLKNLQLTGSASDSDRMKLVQWEMPVENKIQSANDSLWKYDKAYKNEKKNKTDSIRLAFLLQKKDSTSVILERLYKNKAYMDSIFIIENPNSYVAADMLSQSGVSWIAFPSLESLYAKFPVYIQQSFPGKRIKFEIDREAAIPINSDAKPFTAIDSKGDTIQLASYKRKKYVLLDFGASWCSPCRAIIPWLKKEWVKYDTALEIISIANQDEEDDWRKAIKDDQMRWPQIIENKNKKPIEPATGSISDMYYVNTIPSLILIDKNLKIIGKYGGFYYSPSAYLLDLQKKLKDIFQ
jgi:thiol-disulfide isomerase/thioredoxin